MADKIILTKVTHHTVCGLPRAGKAAQPTLDEAVRAITEKFDEVANLDKRATSARVAAGKMLIELRARIEGGEAGEGVSWWEWCEANIQRSRKDCEKLMRMASSDDPEAAIEDERAQARERMQRVRNGANVRSIVTPPQDALALLKGIASGKVRPPPDLAARMRDIFLSRMKFINEFCTFWKMRGQISICC
jgi:hypothetical protein